MIMIIYLIRYKYVHNMIGNINTAFVAPILALSLNLLSFIVITMCFSHKPTINTGYIRLKLLWNNLIGASVMCLQKRQLSSVITM